MSIVLQKLKPIASQTHACGAQFSLERTSDPFWPYAPTVCTPSMRIRTFTWQKYERRMPELRAREHTAKLAGELLPDETQDGNRCIGPSYVVAVSDHSLLSLRGPYCEKRKAAMVQGDENGSGSTTLARSQLHTRIQF